MRPGRAVDWLLLPAGLLWLAGVLAPLLFVLRMSLYSRGGIAGEKRYDILFYQPGTWSLESFRQILAEPFYLRMLGFTIGLALLVTALTLALGYVAAYGIYRSGPAGKAFLLTLIVLPKFTNILVYVFGLKLLLGRNGFWPVVAGETLFLLPYATLTLAATLETVPYSLVETARGLGASAARAFWSVVFPLTLPGLLAAATLALLWSLTAFLGPYLLGEPRQYTLAVEVDRQMRQDLDWPLAAALNVTLMLLMAGVASGLSLVRRRAA
ncbi:MAG: ABC transporter permease subunit [Acidobacteria bacterium]|nr:ABC transporter permease subunit [Acidobacteriota bacterium]